MSTWKLKILPRIKTFIWLLCIDKLPTRLSLHSKHLLPESLCNSCFSKKSCRHSETPQSHQMLMVPRKVAIQMITSSSSLTHCNTLINDCIWLLSRIEHLGVHHIFGEGNRVADVLANLGCSLSQDFCLFYIPLLGFLVFVDFDHGGVG
ncbi:hypothetical protein LIER_08393 [Lithospermum erythrorhizon]|uniref:RNase H type-1 domain-containing protein n=1 Tax=Lithospermum erythrorhizon TaxID=34254 RepID=A0AAV3PGH7_LITER